MRGRMDVLLDGTTARMIHVAKAARLAECLPVESGKALVALAQGVREFALAREMAAATSVTEQIDKLVASHDDESFVAMIGRHTAAVRKALQPNGRDS